METSKISGREIVHVGSVKDIERVDKTTLGFRHTDRFSVFDVGPHPQQIPGMGKAVFRCTMASDRVAKAIGIRTSILGYDDERTILVKEFDTPKGRPLRPDETNVMIPLEFIDREFVSGRLAREFKSGEKRPTEYGFASDEPNRIPQEGTQLPFPHYEVTTKWEDVDRPMDLEEALKFAGITCLEWVSAWRIIAHLNGALSLAAAAAGYERLDGKKELAFGNTRQELVVIDSAGNPNEDRYTPKHTLDPGNVDHWSKEFLRQIFIKNGYKKALDEARRLGQPDPPYPRLSDEDIAEVSRRYTVFADQYERAADRMFAINRT